MIVTWSTQARRDLDAIHAYLTREASAERALAIVSDIVMAVDALADFPEMGRPGLRSGTRELVLPRLPYIIPYRVRGQTVTLLRVLHTARRRKP